jgi:hypothetical protein
MANFLNQLNNPQINHEVLFEVMRDFRKGGLHPDNYESFLEIIRELPPVIQRKPDYLKEFDHLKLTDVSQEEHSVIMQEVFRRCIQKSKFCWHPQADSSSCNVDSNGDIIISAAHSIQNNGVLSQIVENGHVMQYIFHKGNFDGKETGKNYASIFLGFCNSHDAIFRPIENFPYSGSDEQHFLFAYRGFVVSAHKKIEASHVMNFGEQSEIDLKENKNLFDHAIINSDYTKIKTEVIELPSFYPIAVSSSFYLDFDFEGNPIKHSDDRMEMIFITLLPQNNKTFFLISYFEIDESLYGQLGSQLRNRNNIKSDITMLIAAHTENVYFNPTYYKTFIEHQKQYLEIIMQQAQFDYGFIQENDDIQFGFSLTPSHYLNNEFNVNFFGY